MKYRIQQTEKYFIEDEKVFRKAYISSNGKNIRQKQIFAVTHQGKQKFRIVLENGKSKLFTFEKLIKIDENGYAKS